MSLRLAHQVLPVLAAVATSATASDPRSLEDAAAALLKHQLTTAATADGALAEQAWAAEVRRAAMTAVAKWPDEQLLSNGSALNLLLGEAGQRAHLAADLGVETRPVTGIAPPWLLAAIADRVGRVALAPGRTVAGSAAAPAPASGWVNTLEGSANWASPVVWSGPTVRDRVASYRAGGTRTRVRLAVGDLRAAWKMAESRGAAARLALDADVRELSWDAPLPLRLALQLPAWFVTAQGLVATTLVGLRSGDSCDGGSYSEYVVEGAFQAAVWGVLFLPDAAAAKAARVRRLPAPTDPEERGAAQQVGRLEVAWPDARMPRLHIVAKRFGDIWGSYAELPDSPSVYEGQARKPRISASGTPECALR